MNSVRDLVDLLDLRPVGRRGDEDLFEGSSAHVPDGRIYGGQLLAQAAVAAALSVNDSRVLNSLHGYFLRAGDVEAPVTYGVEALRDGRSFTTRRVQGYQRGQVIFSAIASLQDTDAGPSHETPMPLGLPSPDSLAVKVPYTGATPRDFAAAEELIEVREVPDEILAESPMPTHAAWIRVASDLAGDARLRQAAIAYLSDAVIQLPILAAHGLDWWEPDAAMASLDHSIWWYVDHPLDGWLLAVQESPVAAGARGLGIGRIYSPDGTLLAAAAQEMLIRLAAAPPTRAS